MAKDSLLLGKNHWFSTRSANESLVAVSKWSACRPTMPIIILVSVVERLTERHLVNASLIVLCNQWSRLAVSAPLTNNGS